MGNTYVEPFQIKPYLSCASLMMERVMLRESYEYGKGIGKVRQGSIFPLKIVENKNRYGRGYKPTKEEKRRLLEEKKERSLARLQGREPKVGKISVCDLKKSFRSARWINTSQVAAVEDESREGSSRLVQPCPPDMQIDNWKTVNLPVVFKFNQM